MCRVERSVAQVKTDFLQTAKCVCAACYEHTLKGEAGCSLARPLFSPLRASTPFLVLEGVLAWFLAWVDSADVGRDEVHQELENLLKNFGNGKLPLAPIPCHPPCRSLATPANQTLEEWKKEARFRFILTRISVLLDDPTTPSTLRTFLQYTIDQLLADKAIPEDTRTAAPYQYLQKLTVNTGLSYGCCLLYTSPSPRD